VLGESEAGVMSSPQNQPESNRSRVLLAILILSCLVFMVSYAGRLVEKWRVERDIALWQQRVDEAHQTQAALAEESQRVQSQDYVDEAARNELGLSKEGDAVVVIVEATPTAAPAPVVEPAAATVAELASDARSPAAAEQSPAWQQWWALFAGPASGTP
jgi:cell division protein FtsB/cell division protein DivIC